MSPRPRTLVIGGTGAQGGSVARHLLAEGRCRVRCLTRRLDSVAARSLADAGAEVVQGDMADPDSLDAALAGCEAVFGVTNYFEHKARLEALVRGKEIFATFVHVAFYYENFLFNCQPQRQADGSYAFGFPLGNAPLSAVAVGHVRAVSQPRRREARRPGGQPTAVSRHPRFRDLGACAP